MFDSVLADEINESNKAHAANHLALAIVLFDKGILTVDEYERARIRGIAMVDQEWAAKKERVNHASVELGLHS